MGNTAADGLVPANAGENVSVVIVCHDTDNATAMTRAIEQAGAVAVIAELEQLGAEFFISDRGTLVG